MLRRVILSYLKKCADLQHDFAAEVRKRQIDKWEQSQLDKLDPTRVLERRKLEVQNKERKSILLNQAMENPQTKGLELIAQGLITGKESEFVDAVQKFIEDQPRQNRDALTKQFEEAGVPLREVSLAALPTGEATSMVLDKWRDADHEDGDIQELHRLQLENKITEQQSKVIAVNLIRINPHRCIAFYKRNLVSKEQAESKFGAGIARLPLNHILPYLEEGSSALGLDKETLRDLILDSIPEEKSRTRELALQALKQIG